MDGQRLFLPEALIALFAVMWLFFRVGGDVDFERLHVEILFSTEFALVELLAQVRQEVVSEIRHLGKCSVARMAPVRLRMRRKVGDEQIPAVERFVALVANIILFIAVHREMFVEAALVTKHFVANLADKPSIAVRQCMLLQIASLKKASVALAACVGPFCTVSVEVSGKVAPRRK